MKNINKKLLLTLMLSLSVALTGCYNIDDDLIVFVDKEVSTLSDLEISNIVSEEKAGDKLVTRASLLDGDFVFIISKNDKILLLISDKTKTDDDGNYIFTSTFEIAKNVYVVCETSGDYGTDSYKRIVKLINTTEARLYNDEYTDLVYAEKDTLVACKDNKYGLINTYNGTILDFDYDFIAYDYMEVPDGKYYEAVKDGKAGIIDNKGNEIIPFIYDTTTLHNEGGDYTFAGIIIRDNDEYVFEMYKEGKYVLVKESGEEFKELDKKWNYNSEANVYYYNDYAKNEQVFMNKDASLTISESEEDYDSFFFMNSFSKEPNFIIKSAKNNAEDIDKSITERILMYDSISVLNNDFTWNFYDNILYFAEPGMYTIKNYLIDNDKYMIYRDNKYVVIKRNAKEDVKKDDEKENENILDKISNALMKKEEVVETYEEVKPLLDDSYDLVLVVKNNKGKYGLIGKDFNQLLNFNYDSYEINKVNDSNDELVLKSKDGKELALLVKPSYY